MFPSSSWYKRLPAWRKDHRCQIPCIQGSPCRGSNTPRMMTTLSCWLKDQLAKNNRCAIVPAYRTTVATSNMKAFLVKSWFQNQVTNSVSKPSILFNWHDRFKVSLLSYTRFSSQNNWTTWFEKAEIRFSFTIPLLAKASRCAYPYFFDFVVKMKLIWWVFIQHFPLFNL